MPQVELARPVVLRVHLHGEDTQDVGHAHRALERVAQENLAESLPLSGALDGAPGEENHGGGIARKPPPHALRKPLEGDGAACERVVAEHARLPGTRRHVGAADVPLLVLPRVPPDEVVELGLAAIEIAPVMMPGQQIDDEGHAVTPARAGAAAPPPARRAPGRPAEGPRSAPGGCPAARGSGRGHGVRARSSHAPVPPAVHPGPAWRSRTKSPSPPNIPPPAR